MGCGTSVDQRRDNIPTQLVNFAKHTFEDEIRKSEEIKNFRIETRVHYKALRLDFESFEG